MRPLRISIIVCAMMVLLAAVACGGGAQPATGEPPSGSTTATAAPAASRAPTSPAPTARPATATIGTTHTVIDMSRSSQPGSTIAGTIAEQMVFGREYDAQKPEILQLAWTFPVDSRQIYFGFGIDNGPQRVSFTQTLTLNGEEVPLPVKPFSVPPSGPGKKQFHARGVAVKPGKTFPEGRYEIFVYANGELLQRGIFDVKQPIATSALNVGVGVDLNRYRDSAGDPQQVDPDIFVLTEQPIEAVPEDFSYYAEGELEQAYDALNQVAEEYKPFPDDVQQAIEEAARRENVARCGEIGGAYDPAADTCTVSDPAGACAALGGVYEQDTCDFRGAEEAAATPSPTPTRATTRSTLQPLSLTWRAGAFREAGTNEQGVGIWAQEIFVEPLGGAPPYTILFDNSPQAGTPFEVFGLFCVGQVGTITVRSSDGQSVEERITVPDPICPTQTPTVTHTPVPTEPPLPPLPITHGFATINGVDILGQGRSATTPAGSSVTVQVDYFIIQASDCPSCIQQIAIGVSNDVTVNQTVGCAYDGIPSLEGESGTGSVTFDAPTEPGWYFVRIFNTFEFSCRLDFGTTGSEFSIGRIYVP